MRSLQRPLQRREIWQNSIWISAENLCGESLRVLRTHLDVKPSLLQVTDQRQAAGDGVGLGLAQNRLGGRNQRGLRSHTNGRFRQNTNGVSAPKNAQHKHDRPLPWARDGSTSSLFPLWLTGEGLLLLLLLLLLLVVVAVVAVVVPWEAASRSRASPACRRCP